MTTPDATATTASPLAAVRLVAQDIRLAHSVFALPFAVLAAIMAAAPAPGAIDWSRFAGQLALVVVAMVFARTVAMVANRIIDRRIDEKNPRTAGRALPSGRLTLRAAVVALTAAAAAFMGTCAGFGLFFGNWWPLILGAPVLLWIAAYAYLKRFTALCHLYLGTALALSPLAAALAVAPAALTTQPSLWLLAVMVMCWVAGFDVIYALQDVTVDRAQGLHSVPGRLGVARGLVISRLLHGVASVALVAAALVDPRFGVLFGLGIVIVVGLLAWEHATVARWGTTKVALAFFTLNGIISCVLGLLGSVDVLAG